jgi:hypothetical protein
VQVHRGGDDGVEIFGGTVDIKHLVITEIRDDALDWDYGWRGRSQFLVARQLAGSSGSGIEADNNSINDALEPRSAPVLYNSTFVGWNGRPGAVDRVAPWNGRRDPQRHCLRFSGLAPEKLHVGVGQARAVDAGDDVDAGSLEPLDVVGLAVEPKLESGAVGGPPARDVDVVDGTEAFAQRSAQRVALRKVLTPRKPFELPVRERPALGRRRRQNRCDRIHRCGRRRGPAGQCSPRGAAERVLSWTVPRFGTSPSYS